MAMENFSIEKCEIDTLAECNVEPTSLSVDTVSTSLKKTKKSKAKVKAAVATVTATQELSEAERLGNLSVDHPYLSVLYKRIRSHRKKLEKIKSLELAQQNENKVPNAQQLDLMSNKATFEKLVGELEMLREQFIGVFSEELERKKGHEAGGETGAADEQPEETQPTGDRETVALKGHQETKTTQEEKNGVGIEKDFVDVFELLKTLHVVNLYHAQGKEVPMVLDFFSKVLLGKTRPPAELSYDENLMESLEEAKKYLMDSDKMFACETTYSGLKAFVHELEIKSLDKEKKCEGRSVLKRDEEEPLDKVQTNSIEETVDVLVVPAEINTMPQISFFTDSLLEAEHVDKVQPIQLTGSPNVAVQVRDGAAKEACLTRERQREEQCEGQVISSLPSESISTPPLSFAAVAASGTSEQPSTSLGSCGDDKKVVGNSPQKSARRRGQGRWREKSSSNSGSKSNGSPSNEGKPRPPRVPRSSDDNNSAQGGKRNGWKEDRRPRFDRGLRKQGNSTQQATTPLIAPHA